MKKKMKGIMQRTDVPKDVKQELDKYVNECKQTEKALKDNLNILEKIVELAPT